MIIDVLEGGTIRLQEVYNLIILETKEGKKFSIRMRDNGLELGIPNDSMKCKSTEKFWTIFKVEDGDIRRIGSRKRVPIKSNPLEVIQDALSAIVYDSDMERNRWGLWMKAKEALRLLK